MLKDILNKCGSEKGSVQDLQINYDVIPVLRIAGIAISPTIHQSTHFPCPISVSKQYLNRVSQVFITL